MIGSGACPHDPQKFSVQIACFSEIFANNNLRFPLSFRIKFVSLHPQLLFALSIFLIILLFALSKNMIIMLFEESKLAK